MLLVGGGGGGGGVLLSLLLTDSIWFTSLSSSISCVGSIFSKSSCLILLNLLLLLLLLLHLHHVCLLHLHLVWVHYCTLLHECGSGILLHTLHIHWIGHLRLLGLVHHLLLLLDRLHRHLVLLCLCHQSCNVLLIIRATSGLWWGSHHHLWWHLLLLSTCHHHHLLLLHINRRREEHLKVLWGCGEELGLPLHHHLRIHHWIVHSLLLAQSLLWVHHGSRVGEIS